MSNQITGNLREIPNRTYFKDETTESSQVFYETTIWGSTRGRTYDMYWHGYLYETKVTPKPDSVYEICDIHGVTKTDRMFEL